MHNQPQDQSHKASELAATVASKTMAAALRRFDDRELTEDVAAALIGAGIDYPECLLFMSKTQLRNIPGVGKVSLARIEAYRERFLPKHGDV
jgi:hypothetical protein